MLTGKTPHRGYGSTEWSLKKEIIKEKGRDGDRRKGEMEIGGGGKEEEEERGGMEKREAREGRKGGRKKGGKGEGERGEGERGEKQGGEGGSMEGREEKKSMGG